MELSRKIIGLVILLVGSLLLTGLSQAIHNTSSLLPDLYLPMVFKDFHLAQLAFKTTIPDTRNTLSIYKINEDGSDLKELISTTANTHFSFNWSPDGTKLVFQSFIENNFDIFIVNADGTGFIQLTYDPADDEYPTWSGDGTHITFQSERNGSTQIFVMDADGSDVIQLTDLVIGSTMPYWSPMGNKIVFDNYGNNDNDQEIYVVNSDGTGLLRLTDNAYYDVALGWSPDGTKLLFLSNRDQGGVSGVYDLYVMNWDGTNPVRLTASGSVKAASWSPDGAKIAYSQLIYPTACSSLIPMVLIPAQCDARLLQSTPSIFHGHLMPRKLFIHYLCLTYLPMVCILPAWILVNASGPLTNRQRGQNGDQTNNRNYNFTKTDLDYAPPCPMSWPGGATWMIAS